MIKRRYWNVGGNIDEIFNKVEAWRTQYTHCVILAILRILLFSVITASQMIFSEKERRDEVKEGF